MAAVLYPEVQRKAQAEVDSIVGKDRLPSFQDRESLPYVEAVVKELYRWLPIVPLGTLEAYQRIKPETDTLYLAVPHRAMQDNVYKGYYIPKDSLVNRSCSRTLSLISVLAGFRQCLALFA